MTDDLRSFDPEVHQKFLHDTLMPSVVSYAVKNDHPTEAVALVTLLAMATILQSRGYTANELKMAVDVAKLSVDGARQEVLQ